MVTATIPPSHLPPPRNLRLPPFRPFAPLPPLAALPLVPRAPPLNDDPPENDVNAGLEKTEVPPLKKDMVVEFGIECCYLMIDIDFF